MSKLDDVFSRAASRTTNFAGNRWAFFGAGMSVLIWLSLGPHYGWSTPYQMPANTFTTLVTYLMVFLIQNTQNRETKVLQIKLDEILRALDQADNSIINVAALSDESLQAVSDRYKDLGGTPDEKTGLPK